MAPHPRERKLFPIIKICISYDYQLFYELQGWNKQDVE